MSDALIQVRDLRKTFTLGPRTIPVLREVSFDVAKGEIVAIVGRSGSGKTTLLHTVGTLESPDSGSIIIDDRDIAQLGDRELDIFRNTNIGFLFQFFQLLPEFTALENAMMPLLIQGKRRSVAKARATELLVEVGLEERLDHHPSQLSGGEQQRAAFARSLVCEPRILLADEPTGNLDIETGNRVFDLLCDLQQRHGLTTIIVTHNTEIAEHCDRVLSMNDLNRG